MFLPIGLIEELEKRNKQIDDGTWEAPTHNPFIPSLRKPYTRKDINPLPKKIVKMPTWEEHIEATYNCKCFSCPGLYSNELKGFVGFRGYQQPAPKGSHAKGFLNVLDIHGEAFEGEGHPRPAVPVAPVNEANLLRITGKTLQELGRLFFLGILKYEVEILVLKFTLEKMGYSNIMVLMGRGLGKTWMEDWENSIRMKWFGRKILLLSESDAGKDVGDWIYNWAFENDLIMKTDKGAKGQTYLSFTLYNGSKLYVYEYMAKKSLGKHEIQIVGDDMVNLDWKNRPADEKRAQKHWHQNLNHMNRIGFDVWGTCKYEGDLLGHFQAVIRNLIVIKISPFKQCIHQPIANDNGVFEECHICKDESLLAPELHSYEDYMDKKEENYDAWYSEQMQNPYRKSGGMVGPEAIHYVKIPHFSENVILGGVGVDIADTTDQLNDMCGIVSCLMQRVAEDKREKRRFVCYASDVARRLARNSEVLEKKKPCDWSYIDEDGIERRIVRGIIETVQLMHEFHKIHYPHVPFIVAFERNRSGIPVIEQALLETRNKTEVEIEKGLFVPITWTHHLIPDHKTAAKYQKLGKKNVPMGITNRANKENRVYSGLKHSIEEGQLCFTLDQKLSVLMSQLLSFPNGKHDDGPDALEMIKTEENRRWSTTPQPRDMFRHEEKKKEKRKEKRELETQPWLLDQRQQNRSKIKQDRNLKRYGLK